MDTDRYHYYVDQLLPNNTMINDYDKKIILESLHAAKFLSIYNPSIEIHSKVESPDFTLKLNDRLIGLEHEILVDQKTKQSEESVKDLVSTVEKEYRKKNPKDKLLVSIYMKKPLPLKKTEKPEIINKMLEIIEQYIFTNTFPDNKYIKEIDTMRHSRLDFVCNLGPWLQNSLSHNSFQPAVTRKEKKINEYRTNSGTKEQWLLIVIGSLNASSYEIESPGQLSLPIRTEFNKVFILEDFHANLFELK